jgi:two-component system, cell cycle sensor histidine kinase and response regulator CckA
MSAVVFMLGRAFSPSSPGGFSRLAALGFFLLALFGAAIAIGAPQDARFAGMILLAAIGMGALLILAAALPRKGARVEEARRAAAAASAANAAWAVTSSDGSVVDCNAAYRYLAGAGEGEPPAPPQLAFPGQGPAAALYRLSRAAIEGRAREELFETEQGQRLSAAVQPLVNGEAAWWFTSRLPGAVPMKSPVVEKRQPSALIRFSDFFRNAPMGVAVVSADGRIEEANAVFARFFTQDAALAGVSFAGLVRDSERDGALERIASAASSAAPPALEIHNLAGGGKQEGSALLYASPFMPGPEGEKRAILYIVDTSEQKALESQFAQAQKMESIGRLAGNVAHDFNNILQAIMGNCDLLLMRHPAGDPSFAEINEVRQNSVRAAGLVRQLLAFSRQQTLQPKVLALGETIGELSMMLRRLAGEKIALKLEHPADLWPVRVDEGQISNAIVNLAVNARDAIPAEGGTVTIRMENLTLKEPRPIGSGQMPAGDYVTLEVADTGCGIPKENQVKIFEPFFTTKPVGQGTGLGLSTVYGIVKQTGGFITVESEPGQGTAFRIYLPRHAAAAAEAPAAEPVRAAPRDVTGVETILLAEDEDAVRNFAGRALRMRGYTVIEAPNGDAALEIVKTHEGPIHLLVSDVMMPGMEGPMLARAALRLRPDLRVILMSGYAEDAFGRSGEKAEDWHFLPKPFGLKQLVAKVKDVLSGAAPPAASKLGNTGT